MRRRWSRKCTCCSTEYCILFYISFHLKSIDIWHYCFSNGTNVAQSTKALQLAVLQAYHDPLIVGFGRRQNIVWSLIQNSQSLSLKGRTNHPLYKCLKHGKNIFFWNKTCQANNLFSLAKPQVELVHFHFIFGLKQIETMLSFQNQIAPSSPSFNYENKLFCFYHLLCFFSIEHNHTPWYLRRMLCFSHKQYHHTPWHSNHMLCFF